MMSTTMEKDKNTRRPVHEVRLGRVKGAIFANESDSGVWHCVVLKRLYRDGEGKWRSSDSFNRDDLLLVGKVSDLCHSWVCQAVQNGSPSPAAPESEIDTF